MSSDLQHSNGSFLEQALAIFAEAAPAEYRAAESILRRAPCRCEVDEEVFQVRTDGGGIIEVVSRPRSAHALRIGISSHDIVRLVDGSAMLEGLLASESLRLHGDPDALLALSELCDRFIAATLHCRSMQQHFERYRNWVSSRCPGL